MSAPERDTHLPPAVREALRDLGGVISAARRERGFTQKELADRVGVSRDTLARIEAGAAGVAIGAVLTSAWVLGLPILAFSDFAAARATSSVAEYLSLLERRLPKRVRDDGSDDDDF